MRRVIENNPNTVEHWDEVYSNDRYDLHEDNLKHALIAVQIIDGTRVVDYGCGPGEILERIARLRPHCELIGVDQSLYPEAEVNIVRGSVYEPVTDCANYVISTEVLEHLDDPQKAVDCLYSSLETGGTAFVSTPYLDHIPSGEHIWEFDLSDMVPLFQQFAKTYVFPFASGRMATFSDGRVYPSGNVDTILVRAIK